MTTEQLKELKEKAELWDSLSPILKTIHGSKFERPTPNLDGEITENGKGAEQFNTLNGTTIIQNTSNASTFIDVLKEANKEIAKGYVGLLEEESKEMVSREKNFQVKFGSISIGDEFECYGDLHLNYDYPKICKCVKVDDECGEEIDGIRFLMHKSDIVFI